MTLRAVIAMLSELKAPHAVTVSCASDYLVTNMMEGHAHRWRCTGWKTARGKPIKFQDLWERILALGEIHQLRFEYPKWPRSAGMIRAEEMALRITLKPGANENGAPNHENRGAAM
jgi:ribonuclease HI